MLAIFDLLTLNAKASYDWRTECLRVDIRYDFANHSRNNKRLLSNTSVVQVIDTKTLNWKLEMLKHEKCDKS